MYLDVLALADLTTCSSPQSVCASGKQFVGVSNLDHGQATKNGTFRAPDTKPGAYKLPLLAAINWYLTC